jgi:hypothetical protein
VEQNGETKKTVAGAEEETQGREEEGQKIQKAVCTEEKEGRGEGVRAHA